MRSGHHSASRHLSRRAATGTAAVDGRLVWADGRPTSGHVHDTHNAPSFDDDKPETDKGGRFRLDRLRPGLAVLEVGTVVEGLTTRRLLEIRATPGEVTHLGEIRCGGAAPAIQGKVINERGDPLNATLTLAGINGALDWTFTDDFGRFCFAGSYAGVRQIEILPSDDLHYEQTTVAVTGFPLLNASLTVERRSVPLNRVWFCVKNDLGRQLHLPAHFIVYGPRRLDTVIYRGSLCDDVVNMPWAHALPVGTATLWCWIPDRGLFGRRVIEILSPPDPDTGVAPGLPEPQGTRIDIAVYRARTRLSGRLVGEDDKPASGTAVRLCPAGAPDPLVQLDGYLEDDLFDREAVMAGRAVQSRFDLRGLPAGVPFDLHFSAAGDGAACIPNIVLRPGEERDLGVIRLHARDAHRGRARSRHRGAGVTDPRSKKISRS